MPIIRRVAFGAWLVFLLLPSLSFAQWQLLGQVRDETDDPNFVVFLDDQGSPNIGFTSFVVSCADGFCDSLYKTTDRGKTWKGLTSFSVNNQAQNIAGVVFKDSLTGWLCTDAYTVGTGVLYSTTDGGISWNIAGNYPVNYLYLYYYAPSKCVIATTRTGLVESLNDGHTFSFAPNIGRSGGINHMLFFDQQNFLSTSGMHTNDGGVTWQMAMIPYLLTADPQPYYSPLTGELYVVTSNSVNGRDTLYVSKDQGKTWEQRYVFRFVMWGQVVGSCKGLAVPTDPYDFTPGNGGESMTFFSSDFGFTWDSIAPVNYCDGPWEQWFVPGGISMTHTALYVCNDTCQVRAFDLPSSPLSFSCSTAVTKNGYETDLTVSIDSLLKQYPINSFEALIQANFSLQNVTIQPTPGWLLDTSSIDSESLTLNYFRDTSSIDTNSPATIAFIYSDSVSKELQFSVTPILYNGQTITDCISDSSYTFSPRCADPILRTVLNGENPFDFRVFQNDGSNVLSLTVNQTGVFQIEAVNSLGEPVGSLQLGEMTQGNYQYDLNALFPNQRFMFVRLITNDGIRVTKVPIMP